MEARTRGGTRAWAVPSAIEYAEENLQHVAATAQVVHSKIELILNNLSRKWIHLGHEPIHGVRHSVGEDLKAVNLTAGGLAGLAFDFSLFPIDSIKTRLQVPPFYLARPAPIL